MISYNFSLYTDEWCDLHDQGDKYSNMWLQNSKIIKDKHCCPWYFYAVPIIIQ